MWDLPRPGLEPVSPALAGGFLTTVPPGKSRKGGLLTDADRVQGQTLRTEERGALGDWDRPKEAFSNQKVVANERPVEFSNLFL